MSTIARIFGANASLPETRPEQIDLVKEYLRDKIGRRLDPVVAEGGKIRLDMAHYDESFVREVQALDDVGIGIAPLIPEEKEFLRSALKGDFASVSLDAPTKMPREMALETHIPAAPLAVLMMSPVHDYLGLNSLSARLDIFRRWLAVRQALEDHGVAVEDAGAQVEAMAVAKDSPASGAAADKPTLTMFARDKYFVIGQTAFLPDVEVLRDLLPQKLPGFDGIQNMIDDYSRDVDFYAQYMAQAAYDVVKVTGAWFEGGNLVPHAPSSTVFMGMEPYWDNSRSAQLLNAAINHVLAQNGQEPLAVTPITLAKPEEFYHLDLGLSEPLQNGEVLFYPDVTDYRGGYAIEVAVGGDNIIIIDDDDAKAFATNLVASGNALIMTGGGDGLRETLNARGYVAIGPQDYDVDSFVIGNGGVHCMTNVAPAKISKGR